MAITKLNSLAIPDDTIVEADLSYPLTGFSSTGIDDNATSTAVTIDSVGNVGIDDETPDSNLVGGISSSGILLGRYDTTSGAPSPAGRAFYCAAASNAGGYTSGSLLLGARPDANNRHIHFFTADQERMRILSSGGITFNGDTAAANALDDYEEGTFTPSFGNDGTTTYITRNGEYFKIGSVVYYSIFIRINTEDSSKTGSAEVLGLPFASKSSATTNFAASIVGDNNWDSASSNLVAYVSPNESKVRFYKNSGSNLFAVSINDIGSDGILYITGWYAT